MKKLLLLFSAALTMLFVGCTQFDDTRIWDAIDELEDLFDDLDNRVEYLEEACEKMNTNIEALQTIVAALQANDTITSIAPIKQGDKIIGYTISFSKSEPITIYHGNDGKDGENGEDGYTPQIGIAKDSDNVYYWTLNGEWLLDENGNKIKAVGTDGKDGEDGEDGITPQLEIRDGYWYISYDNGQSWVKLGKATGEDGKDGANGVDGEDGKDGENGKDGADGDSLFQSVTWDEEYAYFTLSDGTVIKISLASDSGEEEGDLPPANEIWYTTTDEEVVTPNATHVFGANIVSNTYENGKGVITFDGDVTTIGYEAFVGCSSLASVTIPDRVTSIGDYAFHSCSSLASVSIGNSVTSIGYMAFYECSSLTSITIPDSVTEIGDYAFEGCTSLTSIIIPNSVTSIGHMAFCNCPSLTSVYCKATTPPAGGSYMFYRNASGRKIYVPTESVDAYQTAQNWSDCAGSIVGYDFENGGSGEDTTTPPANEIWYTSTDEEVVTPNYADEFGVNIISNTYENGKGVITFDGDVTTIGNLAFGYCSSLASVTIPESVTEMGEGAFYGCESLASVTIPDSVTSIGDQAFVNCSSLASVTIPDSVTSIGNLAFCGCESLASVTIPDSVTSIGYQAFEYCYSLASVTIPESVTSIGSYAFSGCSSLASVYCKATTPPSLGGSAFYGNASERKIYVPTESVEAYQTAPNWSDYASSIVG